LSIRINGAAVPAANPSAFTGAELTDIAVWKFGVSLGFNDAPMAITIEGHAEIRTNGQSQTYDAEGGIALGARLLELLGRKVSAVAYDQAAKVLALTFDGGVELTLRPSTQSGYETYQVNMPDGSMLVG
jgi:hypothetical protein